jgi:hypothetical protein
VTSSIYIIGGAGTGKSTFMAGILQGLDMGPLKDIHAVPNSRGSLVTLRGHDLPYGGLYLGKMREEFPGTDGLDRASSFVGVDWLRNSPVPLPRWIIAEGATLATEPFLTELAEATDLLLIHLQCDDFITDLRFRERGSTQKDSFVTNTVTRSRNLFDKLDKEGRADLLQVDSGDPDDWSNATHECLSWLGLEDGN